MISVLDPQANAAFEEGMRLSATDPSRALTLFSKAIYLSPEDARFYRGRALLYLELGDLSSALLNLRRGVSLLPNDSSLRALLASVLDTAGVRALQNRQFAFSHALFTESLELVKSESAYLHRAALHFTQRRPLEAEEDLACLFRSNSSKDEDVDLRDAERDDDEDLEPITSTSSFVRVLARVIRGEYLLSVDRDLGRAKRELESVRSAHGYLPEVQKFASRFDSCVEKRKEEIRLMLSQWKGENEDGRLPPPDDDDDDDEDLDGMTSFAAVQFVSGLIQICPLDSELWYQRAICHMRSNQYGDAVKDFLRCRALSMDEDPDTKASSSLSPIRLKTESLLGESLYQIGCGLLAEKNAASAIQYAGQAARWFDAAAVARGEILPRAEDVAEGGMHLQSETAANQQKVCILRGDCHLALEHFEKALGEYRQAEVIRASPLSKGRIVRLCVTWGKFLVANARPHIALTVFSRAIELDNRCHAAYLARSRLLLEQGPEKECDAIRDIVACYLLDDTGSNDYVNKHIYSRIPQLVYDEDLRAFYEKDFGFRNGRKKKKRSAQKRKKSTKRKESDSEDGLVEIAHVVRPKTQASRFVWRRRRTDHLSRVLSAPPHLVGGAKSSGASRQVRFALPDLPTAARSRDGDSFSVAQLAEEFSNFPSPCRQSPGSKLFVDDVKTLRRRVALKKFLKKSFDHGLSRIRREGRCSSGDPRRPRDAVKFAARIQSAHPSLPKTRRWGRRRRGRVKLRRSADSPTQHPRTRRRALSAKVPPTHNVRFLLRPRLPVRVPPQHHRRRAKSSRPTMF